MRPRILCYAQRTKCSRNCGRRQRGSERLWQLVREGTVVERPAHVGGTVAILVGAAGARTHRVVVRRRAQATYVGLTAVLEASRATSEIWRPSRLLLVGQVAIGTLLACDLGAVQL